MTDNYSDRESRNIGKFHSIVLNDLGRLVIQQGKETALEVEADREMLSNVQTVVKNGRLELGMSRTWSERVANSFTLRHIAYYITVKDIKSIELKGISNLELGAYKGKTLEISTRGHCSLKIDSLEVKKFTGKFHWSTTVLVSGTVDEQHITMSGSSKYRAAHLKSGQGSFSLSDKCQAEVTVDQKLVLESSGDSVLQYHGSPKVIVNNMDDSKIESAE